MTIRKDFMVDLLVALNIIIILAFSDYGMLCKAIQVTSCCIIVFLNVKKRFKIKSLTFIFLKLFFVLFCGISYIWAVNTSNIINWSFGIAFRIINALIMIFYIKDEEHWRKFVYFLFIAGLIFCIRMIIVVPFSAWGNERVGVYLAHDGGNGYGFTGITYVLGMISTIIISSENVFKNKKSKWVFGIIFALFSLMSGSKKQIFILAITLLSLAFLKSKNQKVLIKNIILVAISFSVVVFIIMRVEILYNAIGVRMVSFFNYFSDNQIDADASTISRANYMQEAFQIFLKHPFFGVGIDCFRFVNSYATVWAENNYLELLADLGIIGTIIYYIPHFIILKGVKQRSKLRNDIDTVIFTSIICLLFIDFSMVSYASQELQFFLSFIFISNYMRGEQYKDERLK